MTRTKPLHLVLLALLGAGLLWFAETALAATGNAIVIPPFTLSVALVLIGAVIIGMAVPVRRVSRGVPNARIDPFYATRVVVLAKASSLAGSLLAGGGLAIGVYLLTRSVVPGVGSVSMAFASGLSAIVLVVAGLVAEHWCFIPPDDDERGSGRPNPERL